MGYYHHQALMLLEALSRLWAIHFAQTIPSVPKCDVRSGGWREMVPSKEGRGNDSGEMQVDPVPAGVKWLRTMASGTRRSISSLSI